MGFRLRKPSLCRGCSLEHIGHGFTEPEGSCTNGVLALGDFAGAHEAQDGLPFRPQSDSGSLLNRAMGMSGVRREQFALHNIIACQPPRNPATGLIELTGMPFEHGAIEHCKVHLNAAVRKYQPKALLAFGAIALRALTGLTGDRLTLEYLRGYALNAQHAKLPNGNAMPVVSTYHPNFIKRGAWASLPVIMRDIKTAVQVAAHGPADTKYLQYVTHGNQGHLEAMRDDLRNTPGLPLSTDIETNYSELKESFFAEQLDSELVVHNTLKRPVDMDQTITQVNLSTAEGTALVVTATPPNMALVKEILAVEDSPKIGHNLWMYDKPKLEQSGAPLAGLLEDTMWRFHHIWPDLPANWKKKSGDDYSEDGSIANLQFCASFTDFPIPWKHMAGENLEWYGGCDVDSALRVFWMTQREMENLGILDSYYALVQDLMPILEGMRRRGMPVNVQTILELHDHLVREIKATDAEIQTRVPRELFPIHPPAGLKKTPKGAEYGKLVEMKQGGETITARLIQIEVDLDEERKKCCFRARKPGKTKKSLETLARCAKSTHARMQGEVLWAPDPLCPKCGGTGVITLPRHTEVRWTREMPFNVASPNQMWAYAHHFDYKVPKNSKRKFAMDAETIGKLAKTYTDPVFDLCVLKRKMVKIDSTYCAGWMPSAIDDRVHPQIGPYPATGQLSSRKPNSQNVLSVSKQGALAVWFRKALHAQPGHTIIEGDWKSYHVQTLGYECGDPIYIGLAKTDIHSFFTVTGLLKVEDRDKILTAAHANLSVGRFDPELKTKLKWYRKNYKLKNGDDFDKLRDGQGKVAVLAYGLGMQENTLYLKNEDSFRNIGEAKQVLLAMNTTFPKEKLYRDTQPLTVKPNGYKIINRFGLLRWFFDVQRLNRRTGLWEHGDDWEAAIAFNPQGSAHGHLRECVKRNEYAGYNERYQFDNTVHDSLRFHCPTPLVEECLANVKAVMEHASEVMAMPWDGGRGLSVEVEFKIGPNWGEMKEVA